MILVGNGHDIYSAVPMIALMIMGLTGRDRPNLIGPFSGCTGLHSDNWGSRGCKSMRIRLSNLAKVKLCWKVGDFMTRGHFIPSMLGDSDLILTDHL